jgi:hypothetical protein
MNVALCNRRLPVNFRYAPFATEVVRRCNMSLWATIGCRDNVQVMLSSVLTVARHDGHRDGRVELKPGHLSLKS